MNYRVYFNRKREAPQVWSIDEGKQTSEINVSGVEGHRVSFEFRYDPTVKPNEDTPTAWMEVQFALMRIVDGIAIFYHDPGWRKPPVAPPPTEPEWGELP